MCALQGISFGQDGPAGGVMEQYHGTTILSARRGSRVALGGDGQVTLGNIVIKAEIGRASCRERV